MEKEKNDRLHEAGQALILAIRATAQAYMEFGEAKKDVSLTNLPRPIPLSLIQALALYVNECDLDLTEDSEIDHALRNSWVAARYFGIPTEDVWEESMDIDEELAVRNQIAWDQCAAGREIGDTVEWNGAPFCLLSAWMQSPTEGSIHLAPTGQIDQTQ